MNLCVGVCGYGVFVCEGLIQRASRHATPEALEQLKQRLALSPYVITSSLSLLLSFTLSLFLSLPPSSPASPHFVLWFSCFNYTSVHPFFLGIINGAIAGYLPNSVAAFGEELGWRGYLTRQFAKRNTGVTLEVTLCRWAVQRDSGNDVT